MSIRSTATISVPLTAYAQGIAGDRMAAYRLANILSPIVQVGAAVGTYKAFNDKNSFLVEDSQRAIGGDRKRLMFEAGDASYNCKPHGLEIGLDDFEMDLVSNAAGATGVNLLAQGKVKSMVSRSALGYFKRVVDAYAAALTPVAGRGNFSNDTIDPIDQIDEQLEGLSLDVGSTENITIVMSVGSWRKIRGNAKVKSRLGLKPEMNLTPARLIEGLLFPVKLEVSSVTLTTKKFGQAAVATGEKTAVVGSYCIFNYGTPSPTPFDASAFKTFSTSPVLVESVKVYREEGANSDMHAMDWSEDIKQTSTLSARLLAVT